MNMNLSCNAVTALYSLKSLILFFYRDGGENIYIFANKCCIKCAKSIDTNKVLLPKVKIKTTCHHFFFCMHQDNNE